MPILKITCQLKKADMLLPAVIGIDLVMKDVNTIKSHEPVTRNEYEEAKKVVEKTKIVEGSTKDAAEPVDMEVITTKVLKEDESSEQVNTENGDAMLKSNQVMEKAEVVVDRSAIEPDV